MDNFFYRATLGAASEKYEWVYNTHARFTPGLLQLLFTFFDWKTSKWACHLLQFSFLMEKSFQNLSSLLHYLTNVLNLFLFISTFSVFLNDYFFKWLDYKSLLSRFSLLINYIMWSYNIFSVSNCFPHFSWSWFFRVQVQDLGPGFRSSPTLVDIFSYAEEEKIWK